MIRDSSPQLLLCVPNHPYVFILGTDLAPLTNCSGLDGLYSFTSRVSNLYVCGGIPLWHFKLLFLSLKEASWFVIVLLDTNISHSVCCLLPADQYPQINDDLVNSHHLLLCCVEMLYCTCLMNKRKDLLNPGRRSYIHSLLYS